MIKELLNKYFVIHGIRLHYHIGQFEDTTDICTDYIVMLSHKPEPTPERRYTREEYYEVTFSNTYDSCASGYCSATWGNVTWKKVDNFKDFHYKPIWAKENMICFFKEFQSEEEYCSIITLQLVLQPEVPILKSTGNGGDNYYPSGSSNFNDELFEKTERYIDNMRVYIVTGDSGLGKSYIGRLIGSNAGVYETDLHGLSNIMTSEFVIVGNKHGYTAEDIINNYQMRDAIDFIIVDLKAYKSI